MRFDGVILHGMWLYPNWAFFKACTKANIPFICFPHGMLEPWAIYRQGALKAAKKILYWLLRERKIFSAASGIFFTTIRERTLAQQIFNLPPVSRIVVPYGMPPLGSAPVQPARADLAFSSSRKIALFLGRVHPKKNVDFLIEAWAAANPDSDWLLVVAGPSDPAYQRRLNTLTMRYQLQEQVRFVGPVWGTDKAYLLGRASWFLLPSQQENFGISVLEAVNAGCPVAISDQVFLSDYFGKGSEILPVRLASWVEFLRDRMPDEKHRQHMISLDSAHVIPLFSINAVARNWVRSITLVFDAAKTKQT